jgi:hypothetical protein
MASHPFRLNHPITVVVQELGHGHLKQIPAGSVFYAANSKPDANGMINGTYNGEVVMMFERDLADRAEPIAENAFRAGR